MTDLDWNPFGQDLDLDPGAYHTVDALDPLEYGRHPQSPLSEPQSPLSQSPLSGGFLYECATCMTTHSPTLPCNANYTFESAPGSGSYAYGSQYHMESRSQDGNTESGSQDGAIAANYRKWLLSVSP